MDKTTYGAKQMKSTLKMQIENRNIIVRSPIKSGLESDFADAIEALIVKDPAANITLDFRHTPFMNSAALGIMLNCHRELKKKNAGIKLVIKTGSDIHHLMEITKLIEAFEIEWVEQ